MNTISDSLIEKLEELYPKPKAEVAKESPSVENLAAPNYAIGPAWVPDYIITTSGNNCGSYAVQSTNSGWGTTVQCLTYDENSLMIKTAGNTHPLPMYVQKIAEQNSDTRVTVLDRMAIKESTYSGNTISFKQYIDDKMLCLEYRLRDHIRQEIDKLKCSPGTPT